MDAENRPEKASAPAVADLPKHQTEAPAVVDEGGGSPLDIDSVVDKTAQSDPQITRAAEDALVSAKEKAGGAAYIGEQGAAGEAARAEFLKQQGITSQDLNDFSGNSANFPLLDNANASGLESVKVKSVESPLTESGARSYDREFQKLCSPYGNGRSEVAAARLSQPDVRQKLVASHSWPADLPPDASSAATAEYIRNNAKLVVPDDHVEQVRETIAGRAGALPENYGLAQNYTEEDIDRLTSRVQPMGITASEIDSIQARSGTKGSDYWSRRNLRSEP